MVQLASIMVHRLLKYVTFHLLGQHDLVFYYVIMTSNLANDLTQCLSPQDYVKFDINIIKIDAVLAEID